MNLAVNLVKGGGFGFIVLGTLIYNRLIFKQYFSETPTTDNELAAKDSLLIEK